MRRTATAMTFLGCVLTAGSLGAQPRSDAVDSEAELVVAMPDDTQNMDPRLGMGSVRSAYIRQVFESLVDTDPQGRPVAGLALAWKPVGDTAWEWSLRPNVRFHNGEAFNADTVLFNLDRMFRKNLDKWGIKDVPTAGFDKTYPFVSRWEKVNDLIVRIHTTEPAPTLWDFIGREPLVPKDYTIKNGIDGLNEQARGHGAVAARGVEAQGLDAPRALGRLLGDEAPGAAPALSGHPGGRRAPRRAAGRAGRGGRRGARARRQRAGARWRHQGGLEPAEAHLPALPERAAQGGLRLGRQGRPLRRRCASARRSPSRQPGRDRQEAVPRLRAAERLAGVHGVHRLRGPGGLPLRSEARRRRCSPRRAGRTRTATASSTRAARCSRSSSCSPPSTTARGSTRPRRRWPRCSRRSASRSTSSPWTSPRCSRR